MIIYNNYPPQPYGNLKTLCDDLEVSYHTYKVKKYPFIIKGIEVFKTEIKRGGRKNKNKIPKMRHARVTAKKECWDLFTIPTMMGAVIDEDETHIWIGSITNRYPKHMVDIEILTEH